MNNALIKYKSQTIYTWKKRGLKGDIEEVYKRVLNSTNCELCGKKYQGSGDRCMDHCHATGEFRHVLCRRCNTGYKKQKSKSLARRNTSGFINICHDGKGWRFSRNHGRIKYRRFFKSKIDCMCYKIIFILKHKIKYNSEYYE